MKKKDGFIATCPMSGRESMRFGGGHDQCDVCGSLVYIAGRDSRVSKHRRRFSSNEEYAETFRVADNYRRIPSRRRRFGLS